MFVNVQNVEIFSDRTNALLNKQVAQNTILNSEI